MTELTDSEVRALLDGATPGPWRADGEPWNRIVWSSADNRVCFMAHSNGLDDARDIATSNLAAAAPDLARALLDARTELAHARADAQAAVALMVERAADACVDLAAQVSNAALTGLPEQARLRESMEATFTKASHVIRALAPSDGLAAVEALRVEARENAMQALASMGQAQEAYEAQLEAEAELARVKADAAAAQALMVERAAEVCDDLAIGYAKHKGVPGALHDAARDIRALALDAGTAELAKLREQADGMVKRLARRIRNQRVRLRQMEGFKCRCCDLMAMRLQRLKRSNAYRADCDRLVAENAALEAKVAGLVAALKPFCFFSDEPNTTQEAWEIRYCDRFKDWIDFADIESARAALAQTPTDPGDGWTWNERLGWIGPDGKPADPRRG